jgi:hypothetical protein
MMRLGDQAGAGVRTGLTSEMRLYPSSEIFYDLAIWREGGQSWWWVDGM